MQVTLTNQIEITGFSPTQYQAIIHNFTFTNPAFNSALDFGRSTYNIDRTIKLHTETDGALTLPIGTLQYLLDSFRPEVIDQRASTKAAIPFTGTLRPYQERFIMQALQHTHGVMVAATGAGKTVSGIALSGRLGQRCLILVKNKDLAKQWQGAIKQFTGMDAGLIGGGKDSEGEQFTIGLVQTLCKRDLSQLDYGLVIADECHNIPAQQAYGVINGINARYKFGLSATPQRRDQLEFMIHGALGEIVAEIEEQELGSKVLPVSITTRQVAFSSQVESWAEFQTSLVNDDTRNRMIIESALKVSAHAGTIILCAQVGHCELLGVMAYEQGVKALVLHGRLSSRERSARMAAAPDSPLIIGTFALLSEGIDLPHLTYLIMAAPLSAEVARENPAATRLRQSIGRCRRPFPGKTKAFVLDICDKHAFGYAAFAKRMKIYQQQGFEVRA